MLLKPTTGSTSYFHDCSEYISFLFICFGTDGMYDRVKFRHTCTGDGSIKQKAPDKVKPETHRRRKVQFTSSFVLSDSDEEEQGSWRTPRNPLATAGKCLFYYPVIARNGMISS